MRQDYTKGTNVEVDRDALMEAGIGGFFTGTVIRAEKDHLILDGHNGVSTDDPEGGYKVPYSMILGATA